MRNRFVWSTFLNLKELVLTQHTNSRRFRWALDPQGDMKLFGNHNRSYKSGLSLALRINIVHHANMVTCRAEPG